MGVSIMIVTKDRSFRKMTLTIETEEEYDHLFHALNFALDNCPRDNRAGTPPSLTFCEDLLEDLSNPL